MDNLKMEEFIQQIVAEESNPITLGVLKTNCIVNSKLLIEEIESVENKVLSANEKDLSYILLVGIKLKILIQEISDLSNYYS